MLLHQLARAALSAQLNIAEGYALWSTGKFLHHLRIAYGSAVEAHEVLELLLDEGLAAEDELRPMLAANVDCQRSLMGLIRKLQK